MIPRRQILYPQATNRQSMNLVSRLYEWKLSRAISRELETVPKHIVLVLAESDVLAEAAFEKIRSFVSWCSEAEVEVVTIYISIIEVDVGVSRAICAQLSDQIQRTFGSRNTPPADSGDGSNFTEINIYTKGGQKKTVYSDFLGLPELNVSIGYSGKYELTRAIREIMKRVGEEEIDPGDIDKKLIESHLLFQGEPDLVLRSGGKRLTDFLIWQSVYSELYFIDMNWLDFRKLDFLRALRDFQKRQRRFGR